MTFLVRIFRFLFWLLILSWGVALLRRIVGRMLGGAMQAPQQRASSEAAPQEPGTGRRLVRDPVCGVHVAEVLAIPLREKGELVHFCSPACRDAYVGSTKKFAANG
jgi:YHS domain-containing protein